MGKLRKFYLGIGIGFTFLVFWLGEKGIFHRLEYLTFDARFRLRGRSPLAKEIVVVGITQRGLSELGKYPWPRTYYAEVINWLKKSGTKVIAFDITYDTRSPDRKEDEALIKATKNAGNVIYALFSPEGLILPKDSLFPQAKSLIFNLPPLARVALGQGHINIPLDKDGVARRIPPLIFYQGKPYPSLALLAILAYWDKVNVPLWVKKNSLWVGGTKIPLDKKGNFFINFTQKEEKPLLSYRFFAFIDVFRKTVPSEEFKNKIVLIGQTTEGLPNADALTTPMGRKFGVFILADAMKTILERNFLTPLPDRFYLSLLLLFSLLLLVLLPRFKFTGQVLLSFLFLGTVFLLAFLLFSQGKIILPVVPFWVTFSINLGISIFLSFKEADVVITERERELETLEEIGRLTTSSGARRETLKLLLSSISQAMRAKMTVLREVEKNSKFSPPTIWVRGKLKEKEEFLRAEEKIIKKLIELNEPVLIKNLSTFPSLSQKLPSKISFLSSPLSVGKERIGLISIYGKTVDGKKNLIPYSQEDLRLFSILSSQLAVALKNVHLYQDMHHLFLEAIKALSAAIDAKDPYTEGHSERVTRYTTGIARELGLSSEEEERIRYASIFHDIGKIGIKESILKKPGKLTPEEYEEMKKHPQIGVNILKHISEISDIIPSILHHHERYDGTGYPAGLKGKEIPFWARIIAVADAYDAMTSGRAYRKPLEPSRATEEIKKQKGKQFDPKISEAFLSFSFKNLFR